MCGRIVDRLTEKEIADLYRVVGAIRLGIERPPRYNVTPESPVAAVRAIAGDPAGGRELVTVRWGLIPTWSREGPRGKALINARAETIAEKPSFRSAFATRRCLLPVSGFYEWQVRADGTKQPFFIYFPDRPMTFAAVWETWHAGRGDAIESAAVVTTNASREMAVVHNTKERMPVILSDRAAQDAWLDPALAQDDALALLRPLPEGSLTFRPVGPLRGDSPDCLVERLVDAASPPLKIKRPPRPDPNEAQDLQGNLF